MSKGLAGDLSAQMAQNYLRTVFGIDAEDSFANWFVEELQRTSRVLPSALRAEGSLFDIRMRQFDELLEADGAPHVQST